MAYQKSQGRPHAIYRDVVCVLWMELSDMVMLEDVQAGNAAKFYLVRDGRAVAEVHQRLVEFDPSLADLLPPLNA